MNKIKNILQILSIIGIGSWYGFFVHAAKTDQIYALIIIGIWAIGFSSSIALSFINFIKNYKQKYMWLICNITIYVTGIFGMRRAFYELLAG